ncbi:Cort [Phodopus roborovskii]|uniref:Cort protein n=1 Tax=Phodopus roborovskii TaxID=109678 RepID=A0AAV0AAF7_PHORO|nr:Cort [Phodopus roborovskii]
MGSCSARDKWLSAFGLLLLLLWGTAASALAQEHGPTRQDSVDAAKGKGSGLLAFLARWHEWSSHVSSSALIGAHASRVSTSQASSSALIGAHASKVSKRQGSPPLQQPPRQDKKPCKNFFWKTFSSCK